MSEPLRYQTKSILLGAVVFFLAGCGTNAAQNLGNRETFSFFYVLLMPNAAGNYDVPINFTNYNPQQCTTIQMSDTELHQMIINRVYVGPGGARHRFDFRRLGLCNSTRLLFDDRALADIRFAAGGRAHAKHFDGTLYTPGKVDIAVGQIRLVVYSQINGPLTAGAMEPDWDPSQVHASSIPASLVGAGGAPFSPINVPAAQQHFKFYLTGLPTNPDRVAANMEFIARQPTGGARLIAWEGDIVLQDR